MITEERVALETVPLRLDPEQERRVVPTLPPQPVSESAQPSLLWRLILVAAGFGLAMLGWVLVLTALLAFIGLPLFMFGLALMQAQER